MVKYGLYQLNINGLQIPLNLYLCYSTTNSSISTKQGKNKKLVSTIKVLPKDGIEKVQTLNDINSVVPWSELENYYQQNGNLLLPNEIEGLQPLLQENTIRKKNKTITTKGIYPMSDLDILRMNGKHFYVTPGSTTGKKPSMDVDLFYTMLYHKLNEQSSYILVSLFTRGAEQIAAIYKTSDSLRLSCLYPTIPKEPESMSLVVVDDKYSVNYEKLGKLLESIRDNSKSVDSQMHLEWEPYLQNFIQNKLGIVKPEVVPESIRTTGLMDALNNLTI